ncbi:hypothetical protein GUITHDRAFT_153088 [Guillardia theta CCMP2712]|uniref:Uncharacterized protein n=1 Tax=Guillardia theta (strain CCMP2712) TaxID=905079 RepID=L1J7W7_GUITC|nr:hypothetical protein GUITHDRAFT_153088 [Guillardia theta CCMP2712]EKX44194.1 hypothetical protein GUITHDRAFT_153088 [Guillardia theta CCMP2712]|mmetsp:Transcript_13890/g.48013  ORF Transcript_13890/g.48013 Transcript_13890/m.48013 type:complete len:95 (+) Transcript_13890:300-584(+)|eukprot:XP_005831174.1 hypothetical protein GUITHDRAFT_153088 [Guillardia theta CCMP2712]
MSLHDIRADLPASDEIDVATRGSEYGMTRSLSLDDLRACESSTGLVPLSEWKMKRLMALQRSIFLIKSQPWNLPAVGCRTAPVEDEEGGSDQEN